jgi:F-type H+-transporting ATPase subunit a
MMPLNVIGELAKIVSISFRLFGNIMGGSIIILVISHLIYSLVLPPLLYGFFGLFVGTIQAFVFTMLTIVYISVQVK